MRPQAEVGGEVSAPRSLVAGTDRCEEASPLSGFAYIPCDKPAVSIVRWKGRSDPPIRMCFGCADHNVRNRGGEIVGPFKKEDAGAQTC